VHAPSHRSRNSSTTPWIYCTPHTDLSPHAFWKPWPTSLPTKPSTIKVPAHTNVIGNEAADNIAKKTAKHLNHLPQENPNIPPPQPPFNIFPTEPLNLVQQEPTPLQQKDQRNASTATAQPTPTPYTTDFGRKVRAIWDLTLSNGFMLHPNTVTPKIQTTTLKLRNMHYPTRNEPNDTETPTQTHAPYAT
jgi:hypothetical protein